MQNDLDRETACLQELEAQKQDAQDRLDEMDQQKLKLEDMLNEVRIKCQEESQMVRKRRNLIQMMQRKMNDVTEVISWTIHVLKFILFCLQISTLQSQIHSQESDLQSQEEELSRAKADLGRLQQEENQLEQSLAAGKIQLETIIKSLKATQDEINQVTCVSDSRQQGAPSHRSLSGTPHPSVCVWFLAAALSLVSHRGFRWINLKWGIIFFQVQLICWCAGDRRLLFGMKSCNEKISG